MNLVNKSVKNKMYGVGVVIAQDHKKIVVDFPEKSGCKFVYPDAIMDEYLVIMDKELNDEIAAIKAEKAKKIAAELAAERAKKAEVEKKAAELAARKAETEKKAAAEAVQLQAFTSHTYLVFQGSTYIPELKLQCIWAPKYDERGVSKHYWDRLMYVKEGDIIFHCASGMIKAISRAKGTYVDSKKPYEISEGGMWVTDGRKVDCDYHTLRNPIVHGDYKEKILQYNNVTYAPFNINGKGNQGYLYDLNKELAALFLKEIIKKNPDVLKLDYIKPLVK